MATILSKFHGLGIYVEFHLVASHKSTMKKETRLDIL